MEIFFSDIPEEGLPISGELSADYFDLKPDDSIRVTAPFTYDLVIYAFEEVVAMTGTVKGDVELQCVTCMDFFSYTADFGNWNSEVDIEEGEIKFDPKESLRDDILLRIPSVPHCDELIPDRICPREDLLRQFEGDEDEEELEEEDEKPNEVWSALDKLKGDQ